MTWIACERNLPQRGEPALLPDLENDESGLTPKAEIEKPKVRTHGNRSGSPSCRHIPTMAQYPVVILKRQDPVFSLERYIDKLTHDSSQLLS
jgi:hypothetical protein